MDVRLAAINGRWIASADTPDGPSVGLAFTPRRALIRALEPFDGAIPRPARHDAGGTTRSRRNGLLIATYHEPAINYVPRCGCPPTRRLSEARENLLTLDAIRFRPRA